MSTEIFINLDRNSSVDYQTLKNLYRVKCNEIEMMVNRGYSPQNVMHFKYNKTTPYDAVFYQANINVLDFIPRYSGYEEIIRNNDSGRNSLMEKFNFFLDYRDNFGQMKCREDFSFLWRHEITNELVAVIYLFSKTGASISSGTYQRQVKKLITNNISNNTGEKFRHFILISDKPLGTDNESYNTDRTEGINFEHFFDANLAFNITQHCLVPIAFEYIPPSEVPSWANEEGLQANKLPFMFKGDPPAKVFDAQPTGIVKTYVVDKTYDVNIMYRTIRNPKKIKK